MKKCHHCGEVWGEHGSPGTREDCLKCGYPLHACANCKFYDAAALEWCREPMARGEKPQDPEKAASCSWFVFLDPEEERLNSEKSKSARIALEELFKPPPRK